MPPSACAPADDVTGAIRKPSARIPIPAMPARDFEIRCSLGLRASEPIMSASLRFAPRLTRGAGACREMAHRSNDASFGNEFGENRQQLRPQRDLCDAMAKLVRATHGASDARATAMNLSISAVSVAKEVTSLTTILSLGIPRAVLSSRGGAHS